MIVGSLLSLLVAVPWWLYLQSSQHRLAGPLLRSFGPRPKQRRLQRAEVEAILAVHLNQQKWAFGLVWFSVAAAMMLGAFLLGRIIISPKISYTELADMVALVGDISLGSGAFKLYRTSASQFSQILKSLLDESSGHASSTSSEEDS